MKIKNKRVIAGVIGIVTVLFIYLEMKPIQIHHSTVFKTSERTEMTICVCMNTFLPIDKNELAKNIVIEEQRINGKKDCPVYTLLLYRSFIHYKNDCEYGILSCDENGTIICDK